MEGFLIFVTDAFSLPFLKKKCTSDFYFYFFSIFFSFRGKVRQMKCGSGAVADRHYELNGLTGPGLEMILGPLNFGNPTTPTRSKTRIKDFLLFLILIINC